MRPFLVCVHDASPAYGGETRTMLHDLAPLLGRRLAFAVVPDWHGEWPLAEHPGYCALVRDGADELLLHGYVHRRRRGWGPATLLTDGSDEMSALDVDETRATLARAQRAFADAFGAPARGFLAPAWQRGHVRPVRESTVPSTVAPEYVLGFFTLDSAARPGVPLATWSWDCGRWGWLGHVGHGLGRLSHALGRGVPTLAIHPRDLERGFWPAILRLTNELLNAGYEPTTPSALLAAGDA